MACLLLTVKPVFESGEHDYLGNTITLQWHDSKSYIASKKTFTLPNGLQLTYGQINCLAGDFYGSNNPISNGTTLDQQKQYFTDAWNTLAAKSSFQPADANAILSALKTEVDAVNDAIVGGGNDLSAGAEAYSKLPDENVTFTSLTLGRPNDIPGYLGLSLINFDHFGADARTAYNAGHLVALTAATGKAPADLEKAYSLNAFADHFLEDSFSAGHLRTPRRLLHNNGAADKCAQVCTL